MCVNQHVTEPGTQHARKHTVLCVDDEPVGLHVRRMLLERAGYHVFTALDGPAGLEIFAREPIEAVVLDFAMPGMNGGEVARDMRGRKPHIPILMLSAYTSLPADVSSLVNLSMTKGEGAPALLTKLGSLLDGRAS
jgi:CheY-like chemotaxis protein